MDLLDASHGPLVLVDHAWPSSNARADAAAREVFAAWAARQGSGTGDSGFLVREVRVNHRQLMRQETVVVGRGAAWKEEPGSGRIGEPPMDPSAVDVWAPPADLEAQSRYTANCSECATLCVACRGEGRRPCADCGGDGKQASTAREGKEIKCTRCRGRGDLDCPRCVRRSAACAHCQGTGRVSKWIEVSEWTRSVATVSDTAFSGLFLWAAADAAAWTVPLEQDADIVAEVEATDGPLSSARLPSVLSMEHREVAAKFLDPYVRPNERVTRQRLQVIDLPSVVVHWGLTKNEIPVEFLGRRMLAPTSPLSGGARVSPVFAERAQHLARVRNVGLAVAVVLGLGYAMRGPWYQNGYAWGVFVSALVGAASVYLWRRGATMRRPKSGRWLFALPVALATCGAFVAAGAPDRDRVRANIRAGNFEAAEAELDALGPDSDENLTGLYADLRLAKLRTTKSSVEARSLLDRIPSASSQYAQASVHVDALLLAEATSLLESGRASSAATAIASLSTNGRRAEAARALETKTDIVLARECLAAKDWKCAAQRAERLRGYAPADATKLYSAALALLRAEIDQAKENARAAGGLADRLAMLRDAVRGLEALDEMQDVTAPSVELLAVRGQVEKTQASLRAAEERAARRLRAQEEREAREEVRQSRRQCCKVCTSGCACGNSCISCSKTCRKGPGCAC